MDEQPSFSMLSSSSPSSSSSWMQILFTLFSVAQGILYVLGGLVLYASSIFVRALVWTLSGLYAVAVWPLSRLLGFVLFLLSPFTYTISYATAPLWWSLHFLGQFKPLYPFLGSAAIVGVFAGLVIALVSNYFVPSSSSTHGDSISSNGAFREDFPPQSISEAGSRLARPAGTGVGGTHDDVWLWLEEFHPRKPHAGSVPTTPPASRASPASASRMASPRMMDLAASQQGKLKQQPPGLMSMTILEESSSD